MFLDTLIEVANSSIHRYKDVISYLEGRNVTKEDIERFRIGYGKVLNIPDDGSLDRKRFMEESWKGKKFEGVILLPFTGSMGQIVGLIGRAIDTKQFKIFVTEEAKYTGFFFGLFQALPEIYKTGRAHVVEGPFDTLAMAKVFRNTVGTLTAGLNKEQLNLLELYCDNAVTMFDSDKPGDAATRVTAELVAERNKGIDKKFKLRNTRLGYKDPDECLKAMGLKKFTEYIQKKLKEVPPW